MEFHHSSSGNDLQYLSEWADSLDLDEFCDQSEVREEPLAKRQKTDDDSLQTVGELKKLRYRFLHDSPVFEGFLYL